MSDIQRPLATKRTYIWGCVKLLENHRDVQRVYPGISNRFKKPSLLNQIIEFKLLLIQYIRLAVITGKIQQIC